MNTLVLIPRSRDLEYSLYDDNKRVFEGHEHSYGSHTAQDIEFATRIIRVTLTGKMRGSVPDAIAVHLMHGGTEFAAPVRFDSSVRAKLSNLVPLVPSRIPAEIQLLDSLQTVYPAVPIILFFETSFFSVLPYQEYLYGIPIGVSNELSLRRFGIHGLFHESTCRTIVTNFRSVAHRRQPRIISICLDPKPEVAAAIGVRPMMSTGGMSPLEGLVGEHICGELDPGIVLHLAKLLDWAPEKLSDVMMKNSGLCALAEREVSVAEVLTSPEPELALARDVLRYRILQACCSGIAVMRGIDAIGYSGKYAAAARQLHQWLITRLPSAAAKTLSASEPTIVTQDITGILAGRARDFVDVEDLRLSSQSVVHGDRYVDQ